MNQAIKTERKTYVITRLIPTSNSGFDVVFDDDSVLEDVTAQVVANNLGVFVLALCPGPGHIKIGDRIRFELSQYQYKRHGFLR